MVSQDFGDGGSAVNRAAVPQQDDRSAQMAQQQAQEGGDLELGEVGEVEVAVKPEAMAHVKNHPKVTPRNHLKLPPPGFRVADRGSARVNTPSPLCVKATMFTLATGCRVWD